MSTTDAVTIVKQGGNKITLTVKRLSETTSKLYITSNYWVNVNITFYTVGGAKIILFI